jgi:hypothetical protein
MSNITLKECRRRVWIDFEREMGITKALEEQPNDKETAELVKKARKALEPFIEIQAQNLYRWYHK